MIQRHFSDTLVGNDPAFLNVINTLPIISASDVIVHIEGENGTGKELIAKSIHNLSARTGKPFISVNCRSLSDLVDDELNSATIIDYLTRQFHIADGGTLFLDEVEGLSAESQSRLLRYLETNEIQMLGSLEATKVDVRILVSSSHYLLNKVKQKLFNEDLYYRLNIVPVQLPALRERRSDIPLLLKHLTAKLAEQYNLSVPYYSKAALKAISKFEWPGNVRELRNFAERMLILFSNKEVLPTNLPQEIQRNVQAEGPVMEDLFRLPSSGINLVELEKSLFNQALELSKGNQTRAAALLGITRDVFLYRKKKYEI